MHFCTQLLAIVLRERIRVKYYVVWLCTGPPPHIKSSICCYAPTHSLESNFRNAIPLVLALLIDREGIVENISFAIYQIHCVVNIFILNANYTYNGFIYIYVCMMHLSPVGQQGRKLLFFYLCK